MIVWKILHYLMRLYLIFSYELLFWILMYVISVYTFIFEKKKHQPGMNDSLIIYYCDSHLQGVQAPVMIYFSPVFSGERHSSGITNECVFQTF